MQAGPLPRRSDAGADHAGSSEMTTGKNRARAQKMWRMPVPTPTCVELPGSSMRAAPLTLL